MKQPVFGLLRLISLKNRNLPLCIVAVLLLISLCSTAQTYSNINGRFTYMDSIKFAKLKNNVAGDGFLTTDTTGRIKFKYAPVDVVSEDADYSNKPTITLLNTPLYNSVKLYKNGQRLPDWKFSVVGRTLTLADPRVVDDYMTTDYKY